MVQLKSLETETISYESLMEINGLRNSKASQHFLNGSVAEEICLQAGTPEPGGQEG